MQNKSWIKFILYIIRWQLSTPILALCVFLINGSTLYKTIIANLIGGCIFYWFDKWLFNKNKEIENV
jgi:hypothetical protein